MKARLLIGAVAAISCGPSPDPGQPQRGPVDGVTRVTEAEVEQAGADFQALRDSFLPAYFESRPVRATELGVHEHDERLPAMDRRGMQRRIDQLLGWLGELEAIPVAHLEGGDREDYAIMEFGLRSELLELEETRSWTRDPRLYTATIARGITLVAEREYAPLRDRVGWIVARMDASDEVLAAARANLSAPPLLWTELAVEETRGLIEFLAEDLGPLLAGQAGGAGVELEELVESRDRLVASLREHVEWLESSLLPESNGDFRLGRYLLERKLLYEEHISLSVAELDQLNERAIGEYQEQVSRTAAAIDADRTPAQILDSLRREGPEPGALLDTARSMMVAARDWVVRSDVIALLTTDVPTVREAPSYARGAIASLDAPGPFETGAREAFYNIEENRSDLGYPHLQAVTLHETYPGRYVQASYAREVDSAIRRVFLSRSLVDGWAHYVEQMALDAGYGDGDPALRLALLRRALHRHARWYAALHLHAFGTPMEEIVERFMEIAHLEEGPARREAIRGTYDAAYLSEALGRMQIVDIRNDYRVRQEAEGTAFNLAAFHEQLLKLGLPLPLAREELLPLSDEGARRRRSPAGRRPASTAGR